MAGAADVTFQFKISAVDSNVNTFSETTTPLKVKAIHAMESDTISMD